MMGIEFPSAPTKHSAPALWALACWVSAASVACGQPESFTEAAAQAEQGVVTVRITLPVSDDQSADAGSDNGLAPKETEGAKGAKRDKGVEKNKPARRVTVCTGIAVGTRHVVTSAFASTDSIIRITTPTGGRDVAKLRVIDEFSGLMLVETEQLKLTPMRFAKTDVVAGDWVLSAAGWGAESPVVSFGVVSGVERQQPGYPPLVQLDVRTVETSSGAAVLDVDGRLQAVVVAVENVRPRGLTYAVPASHVARLQRVWQQQRGDKDGFKDPSDSGEGARGKEPIASGHANSSDEVLVLRRRRPEAGMVLQGANQDGMSVVIVQRVHPNSPAARAGFHVGDEVLSVDGVQIRSVYEAVRPVLSRQPGDTLTYRIRDPEGTRDVTLVLGGGVALEKAPLNTVSNLIQPKLDVEGLPDGIRARPSGPRFLVDADSDRPQPADQKALEILQRAMERYQSVIEVQQAELSQAKRDRERDKAELEELKRQISELQKKIAKQ